MRIEHNLGEYRSHWVSKWSADEQTAGKLGVTISTLKRPDGMPPATTPSVLRQLGSLFDGGSVAGLTDRQLIERFNGQRDATGEAAFAALVTRHGPMILHVCRQRLGDRHHSEDAFQAVFFVLARKARSIRDPDLLGNWLYGVARRTARKAKAQLARRREREEGHAMRCPRSGMGNLVEPMVQSSEMQVLAREQAEILYSEIDRLPAPFRWPVVLCYLEGLTLDEAARRLGCPPGTARSRLARACDKLRRGLTRRGVALSAAALVAALSPRSAGASVSSPLCDITTRAAISFAAGQAGSPVAAVLANHVMRSMLLLVLRLVAMTLLFLGAVAASVMYGNDSLAIKDQPLKTPVGQAPQLATKPDPKAPGRMTVTGRVLDPNGKPMKGASVDLVTRPREVRVAASETDPNFIILGHDETDGDGRFRLDTLRTSSIEFYRVFALGTAPGFALGWADLNPDADQPRADFRLLPEQVIRIKLVDVSGMPAVGVEVRVQSMGRYNDKGEFDGASLSEGPPREIRAWPRPAKTDDHGKFELSGIGRDLAVSLSVRDLRFARQIMNIQTDSSAASKEITLALQPARIIEGRVLAADTGKPIPSAVVSVATRVQNEHANGYFTAKFRADAEGRFHLNPIAGEQFTLSAFPTNGEPYLVPQDKLNWVKGAVKASHDIKLPRGILLRGKVTEKETGRPLPRSSIQYVPFGHAENMLSGWHAIVASQDDGSYQIAVAPGKGHLLIFGPTPDYVLEEFGSNRLSSDKPGGTRFRTHAIIAYELKAGDQPPAVNASLRRGVTLVGRVEGPDGQTVTEAFVLTTLRVEPTSPSWRPDHGILVRDGRFELHGLAPEATTRINVLDPGHEWGASVDLSGSRAGEDLTIRLQPCGRAKARFVGPDGKPVAKHQPDFEFVATPGPSQYSGSKQDQSELKADAEFIANVDRKHYWNGPLTDADGRITLPDLIPGALYRILDFSTVSVKDKGAQIRKDFTVKPGETLDLGDILIEKPQAQ